MSYYITSKGNLFGSVDKWYLYKSCNKGWVVMPPLIYQQQMRYEPTYEAARNYLIQQLARTQLT